jgi:heme/copper-type cytochrome/quinol oxidase subunit 2
MENILKTRRTVKQYVAFNVIYFFIATFVVLGIQMNYDTELISLVDKASANGNLLKFYSGFILITILVLAVAIGVIILFYYLIYGFLLRRLNRNYKELKKLEV